MAVNPALMQIAQQRIWSKLTGQMEKAAVVPPGAPMDPAAGGMPPGGDPAAAGGMPPGMPPGLPPGGAPPGMPPGGAPPMGDPNAAAQPAPAPGGMPNLGMFDPSGGAGAMGGGMGGGMPSAGPQKLKPEQMMQMLDFRLYNMQQQLTAIMNSMGIQLPPGALVLPPGSAVAPPAEAALPGGPQDPTAQGGAPAGGQAPGGDSAIQPIQPMQGASPELAAGGGGQEKTSLHMQAGATAALLRSRIAQARTKA